TISEVVVAQQDTSNPANGEADQTVVTFNADDANATYVVTGANGETPTVTANGDGTYTATFSPALSAGSEVSIVGTDTAGNTSDAVTSSVPADVTYAGDDATAPTISEVIVAQQDTSNPANGEADQTVVTFNGDDANATYVVTGANGETPTVVDNEDGTYTATFSPALAAGTEVSITGTDTAGNTSDAVTSNVPAEVTYAGDDATAPTISEVVVAQQDTSNPANGEADQTVVTFSGDDANATYVVTGSNGETPMVFDNEDGTYTATFSPALIAGTEVTVTATDPAGNVSTDTSGTVPAEVTYAGEDTTAPAISEVVVAQQDTSNPA
ncbi:MAG: hypothetical protein JXQ97_17305, partial [Natronospirillum sp.]